MNSDDAIAVMGGLGAITLLVGLFSIMIIVFAPAILLVFNAWDSFAFWYPIAILVTRVLIILIIPINIFKFLTTTKWSYLFTCFIYAIMGIWGYPVALDAWMRLGFNTLTGIELQRAVLTIIAIDGLTTSNSLMTKADEKKDD